MSIEAIGDDRHPSVPATVRASAEIRALMGRYGVVQQDLQQVLKLSQTGVSKRLRGVTPWDINELATVAKYFGVPLSELIAGAERPQPDGPGTAQRGRRSARNDVASLPCQDSSPEPAGYLLRLPLRGWKVPPKDDVTWASRLTA